MHTQIYKTNSGREIIIRGTTAQDYLAISHMVIDNFQHAENFSQLDTAARQAYIEANSAAGVKEACTDERNIVALTAQDQATGKILGYRLLRKGVHRLSGEPVAEGKRLHVARNATGHGLGTQLVAIAGEAAKQLGYTIMTAQATGHSRHFFEQAGFRCVQENVPNITLADRGIASTISYLEKRL